MRNISTLLIVIMLFLLFGCAHDMVSERDRLLMSARYGELQKLVEAEIRQSGVANTAKLFPLCVSYSALKRYDKLFECCDRLESNVRKGDKSNVDFEEMARRNPLIGGIAKSRFSNKKETIGDVSLWPYLLRAEAYIDLAQYEKAIEEAKKAYDRAPAGAQQKSNHIFAMRALSLAYALNGNREEAQRVVNELENTKTPYPYTLLEADKNIGLTRTYLALKEFQKAMNVIQRDDSSWFRGVADMAAGASLKGESMFVWQQLPKLFMQNKCLMETGQIQAAKKGYDEMLKVPQTRVNGQIYWMILYDRGRIAEREDKLKEAISFYRQSIDIIEQQRSSINTEASKIGFVGNKQSVYQRLISSMYADGQYSAAFEYVERSKSRALVDMLATKKDFANKTGDERAIHDLLVRNTNEEKELQVQDISLNKSETRSIMIKNREKLMEQSPELASLVSVTSLAAAEIQSNIPKDEVLIEYYYGEKDMFAFILSAQGLKAVKLDSDNLAENIQQFRKLLESPVSSDYMELSRELYNRLIRPLESFLDNQKIIIVPHGAMHYLSFNALHDGKRYLIERYSIRILPSASVIKYLQAKKVSKPADILVFGNPDLGDPLYDLVYAQNESIAVARTLPKSRVLLRKEATETAFNKYGQGFKFIHFATHGQFNADTPLKSALMLAKDAESDGMLTVDKLYSTKLDADLVTLSACETGLGKIANGDDVVGLTRGFLYAGSRSIVASLWKVDDLATADLMTQFYTNMKTLDKREALRQAQLQTKKKYDHPFYWASFQLTGKDD